MDCREDPRGKTRFYGGTLLLEVPVGAKGTYNVNFIDDVDFTLFNFCPGPMFPELGSVPGSITIQPGKCCYGIGTPDEGCEDDLGQGECDLRPTPRLPIDPDSTCADPCSTEVSCCLPDRSCTELPAEECPGEPVASCQGDPDGDGIDTACGDNCPDVSNFDQADCNDDGQGDVCDLDDGDSDADGCCDGVDACPNDPNKCDDEGQCGCGQDEIDSDGDGCMDCVDLCTDDPNKCEPGICGCGSTHDDDKDDDGDGRPNCVDQCPGVDDGIYAPGCKDEIPTVSGWGVVIMTLLLLTGGKIYSGRRRAARA